MKVGPKSHNWAYMGYSKGNIRGEWQGELQFCDRCRKYRVMATGPSYTYISKRKFNELMGVKP